MRHRLAAGFSSLVLFVGAQLGNAQRPMPTALRVLPVVSSPPDFHSGFGVRASDTTVNHRRASIIGAAVGAVVGGLASAAYILNATATECVYVVSIDSSCPQRSHVVLHTVTIAAGATAGAIGGAWVARRIAGWSSSRRHDPLPNER